MTVEPIKYWKGNFRKVNAVVYLDSLICILVFRLQSRVKNFLDARSNLQMSMY
jgi:hypothetical protein